MEVFRVPYLLEWTSDHYSEDEIDDTITTFVVDVFVPVKREVLVVQCVLILLVYHHHVPPNHHRQR